MFPIGDEHNGRVLTPVVNYTLIAINVLVFFYQLTLSEPLLFDFILRWGVIPIEITNGQDYFALLSSMFLHGGWLHIIGNMLFLWVFGDNVEDAMGHGRFLSFFLACGAAAGLTHALLDPHSVRPLIGASGAISGVVAAYLILYPRVRVWGLFLKGIPLRLPAGLALGFWIILQVGAAFLGGDEAVGWFAHLGGLVAGAVLVPLLRHRYDPLLARVEAEHLRSSR